MLGSDQLYAIFGFIIVAMVAVSIAYVGLNVTPLLANIPGFSNAYTPEIANGVVCQTSKQVFLNNQTLTVNNVQTVNTICTTSYTAQTPSNSVSWLSPFQAFQSVIQYTNNFDGYLYWFFILLNLAIIAAVGLQQPAPSPMVLAILFIVLVVIVIVSMILSNSINTFFNVPVLANTVAKFPQTRALFANLAEYEVLFGLITMIIAAARSRGGGGGSNPSYSARASIGL